MSCSEWCRKTFDRLPNDLELPNHTILNERIALKIGLSEIFALQFDAVDRVPDVFKVNSIVTRHRQSDVLEGFDLEDRGSVPLLFEDRRFVPTKWTVPVPAQPA